MNRPQSFLPTGNANNAGKSSRESANAANSQGNPKTIRNRRMVARPLMLLAIVIAVSIGVVVIVRKWRHGELLAAMPTPDLSLVDPDVADMVRSASSAVAGNPASGAAWGRLGCVLMVHEWYYEAAQALAMAEEHDPLDIRWPHLRGVCLETREPQKALACFRRAASVQDDVVYPKYRLARMLLGQGKWVEAGEQLQRAVQLEPGFAPVRLELGRLALIEGRLDDALHHARWIETTRPHRRDTHVLLCQVHQKRGDAAAVVHELKLIEMFPDVQEAEAGDDAIVSEIYTFERGSRRIFADASRMVSDGRARDAVRLLEQHGGQSAKDLRLVVLLSRAQIATGDRSGALETLAIARQRDPYFPGIPLELGNLAVAEGRRDEAISLFRESIKLQPNSPSALHALGQCLRQSGDSRGAIAALRDSLRFEPRAAPVQRELAELLIEVGQTELARDHLERARFLAPADRQNLDLLKRLNEEIGERVGKR